MVKDKKLKLRAVATEDIKILSALLQDGLVVSSDLHYQKDDESFVMIINRFCWEQVHDSGSKKQPNRCLCGLKFGHVKKVSQRGLLEGTNQFYNLLSITYEDSKNNEQAFNR